jgi:hypothetical protein
MYCRSWCGRCREAPSRAGWPPARRRHVHLGDHRGRVAVWSGAAARQPPTKTARRRGRGDAGGGFCRSYLALRRPGGLGLRPNRGGAPPRGPSDRPGRCADRRDRRLPRCRGRDAELGRFSSIAASTSSIPGTREADRATRRRTRTRRPNELTFTSSDKHQLQRADDRGNKVRDVPGVPRRNGRDTFRGVDL